MRLNRCAWIAWAVSVAVFPAGARADETEKVVTLNAPDRGRPVSAKIDAAGTIHLLFDTPDGPRYAKSTDGGRSFGAALPIVDEASKRPGLEFQTWDLAIGKGGSVHVALGTNAWKLKLPQEEWGYYYGRLAPGGKAFAPLRNINRKPSEGFSLAADDQGNVTACWLSNKLYANVSHDDGKTFAPAAELNPSFDPCNCCTTSTVYGTDGKLAVLYREETNDERDMYLVLWNQGDSKPSRGRISTTLWKLNACPMTYYSVSRRQDGFVAVWPTRGDIYFARLDSRGKLLPPGEIKTSGKSGHRTGVLALSAADGSTLVAWKKDDQLGWQAYDAAGSVDGSPGSAASPGSGVAGVVNADGRFVLFR